MSSEGLVWWILLFETNSYVYNLLFHISVHVSLVEKLRYVDFLQ